MINSLILKIKYPNNVRFAYVTSDVETIELDGKIIWQKPEPVFFGEVGEYIEAVEFDFKCRIIDINEYTAIAVDDEGEPFTATLETAKRTWRRLRDDLPNQCPFDLADCFGSVCDMGCSRHKQPCAYEQRNVTFQRGNYRRI